MILRELTEAFDRNLVNQAIREYDYKKKPPISREGTLEIFKVIKEAQEHLVRVVNANQEIRRDWSMVKKWLDSKSGMLRTSHKTWQGSGLIVEKEKGHRAAVTDDGKLEVSPDMSSVVQWRFVILDAFRMMQDIEKGSEGNPPTKQFVATMQRLAAFLK